MTTYGTATEAKIAEVVSALTNYGSKSIIALEGVPGTGKSFVASIAAQRFTGEPLLVREVQFHQSFSYEEFIEGMRIDKDGVRVFPGIFLEWNAQAHDDPEHRYVLLVEELTRANLPAVLGELITYLEYRNRPFVTVYGRKPVQVAENLSVLATYNPTDRSAINLDAALLRRLRIIRCPPSAEQLAEMLGSNGLDAGVIERLQQLFKSCEIAFPDQYPDLMPFGHGIFADVKQERDLRPLWEERLEHFLRRPLMEPHPFARTIEENFPWKAAGFHIT